MAYRIHLSRLVPHLADNGLTVPSDFLRLVTDQSVRHILSFFSCFPLRPWDAALAEGPSGSRVLLFYFGEWDGRLRWYLYLTPEGYHAVVARRAWDSLCTEWSNPSEWPQFQTYPLDSEHAHKMEPVDFVFVAPTIETFFYRWWLENSLRRKFFEPAWRHYDPTPLTLEEQAYIDFYRQHPVPAT